MQVSRLDKLIPYKEHIKALKVLQQEGVVLSDLEGMYGKYTDATKQVIHTSLLLGRSMDEVAKIQAGMIDNLKYGVTDVRGDFLKFSRDVKESKISSDKFFGAIQSAIPALGLYGGRLSEVSDLMVKFRKDSTISMDGAIDIVGKLANAIGKSEPEQWFKLVAFSGKHALNVIERNSKSVAEKIASSNRNLESLEKQHALSKGTIHEEGLQKQIDVRKKELQNLQSQQKYLDQAMKTGSKADISMALTMSGDSMVDKLGLMMAPALQYAGISLKALQDGQALSFKQATMTKGLVKDLAGVDLSTIEVTQLTDVLAAHAKKMEMEKQALQEAYDKETDETEREKLSKQIEGLKLDTIEDIFAHMSKTNAEALDKFLKATTEGAAEERARAIASNTKSMVEQLGNIAASLDHIYGAIPTITNLRAAIRSLMWGGGTYEEERAKIIEESETHSFSTQGIVEASKYGILGSIFGIGKEFLYRSPKKPSSDEIPPSEMSPSEMSPSEMAGIGIPSEKKKSRWNPFSAVSRVYSAISGITDMNKPANVTPVVPAPIATTPHDIDSAFDAIGDAGRAAHKGVGYTIMNDQRTIHYNIFGDNQLSNRVLEQAKFQGAASVGQAHPTSNVRR